MVAARRESNYSLWIESDSVIAKLSTVLVRRYGLVQSSL